jgi:hypothetical protein
VRVPTDLSVLAIFFIVLGILGIIWGVVLAGLGALSWLVGIVNIFETAQSWGVGALWTGILDIVTGIGKIVAGYGLLGGKYWAWILSIVLTAIWLIGPLLGVLRGNIFAIFGLIIPGLILVYLLTPRIRRFFEGVASAGL